MFLSAFIVFPRIVQGKSYQTRLRTFLETTKDILRIFTSMLQFSYFKEKLKFSGIVDEVSHVIAGFNPVGFQLPPQIPHMKENG